MNTSGIQPLDQRVLVRPDSTESVTAGGIIIPSSTQEQEKYAQMKGTLVAFGANAWAEAKATNDFTAPATGTRILFAKYGGVLVKGTDGTEYRIMNDVDVTAILEES